MADSTYSYSFVDNKNEDGNRGESQPPQKSNAEERPNADYEILR